MNRKALWLLLLACVLAEGAEGAVAAPGPIERRPQISDVAGDANFINYQAGAVVHVPHFGDVPAGNVDPAADILKAWFTHSKTHLTIHVETTAAPSGDRGIDLWITSNWDAPGGTPCLGWEAKITTATTGTFYPYCSSGEPIGINASMVELANGSARITMTIPRNIDPLLKKGSAITQPTASTRWIVTSPAGPSRLPAFLDTTDYGNEYPLG